MTEAHGYDELPIATRAFAIPVPKSDDTASSANRKKISWTGLDPSNFTLTFDTETVTDEAQQLRFGVCRVRDGQTLLSTILFYYPLSLDALELVALHSYGEEHGHEVCPVEEFTEDVFFPVLYDLHGTCIGFNLPFDLSRLAIGHASARKKMRGGFTFKLSNDKRRPRLQIKHITGRASLIQFASPGKQYRGRARRRRNEELTPRRGFFVDVRTLAGALRGGSWSLERLADNLQTEHRKIETDEYSGPLTRRFIDYAVRDVQVTWECYEVLQREYQKYDLTETPIHKVYSEASLGKALLKQMGVQPWQKQQPDVSPELIGIIMSTYYGGRAEVHLRRVVRRVLYCDFLSMYPTVCTLMNLWRFVIAERMEWHDATKQTQEFLERTTAEDWQNQQTWLTLPVLVQVHPDDDILPVRSPYTDGTQHTIGVNQLTSPEPLWYTLADCIASKLLRGKPPLVIQAIRFEPMGVQPDLHPDAMTDFYKKTVDQRNVVKSDIHVAQQAGDTDLVKRLKAKEQALKTLVNATSYGIFVELNVAEQDDLQEVNVYPGTGQSFKSWVHNVEEPGRYFHPLLGTLITGAARLMLALGERAATDHGITWAFCDTDSMALTPTGDMSEEEFLIAAHAVIDWFTPLNPYDRPGPLFKIEEANYGLLDGEVTSELEALYCFCIAAKRYVLFNLDARGKPVLRKVSAHGLGHLLPPYPDDKAPRSTPKPAVSLHDLDAKRWQHDLWYRIVTAACGPTPDQVPLDDLPGFGQPAVSRYDATKPKLLAWFKGHNQGKEYTRTVKPFNFLLGFQDKGSCQVGGNRPVAPYDSNLQRAAYRCFDRITGNRVSPRELRSYHHALRHYHLQSESKFQHGDYLDRGMTVRRHVRAVSVVHIGKEADQLEYQYFLGVDPEVEVLYGMSPQAVEHLWQRVLASCRDHGVRRVAKAARMTHGALSRLLRGQGVPVRQRLDALSQGVSILEAERQNQVERVQRVLDAVRGPCEQSSVRLVAMQAGVDAANLAAVLKGRRTASEAILARLEKSLEAE